MAKSYQPANGSEGEWFMFKWCSNCQQEANAEQEEYCEILNLTMALNVYNEDYPGEWVYDDDGNPKCTAFLAIEGVTPRCDKTVDMFGKDRQ